MGKRLFARACVATVLAVTVLAAGVSVSRAQAAGSQVSVPVATVTGTVTLNGARFTGGKIPFGSTVDVTLGSVTMKSSVGTLRAAGTGRVTAAFKLLLTTFDGKPFVELRLAKGNFGVCPKTTTAGAGHAVTSKTVVRALWANGTGDFQTRGRFAAATVRGTHWLTDDRCDGTWTKVVAGVVAITNFVTQTTVAVPAGHTFLVKP